MGVAGFMYILFSRKGARYIMEDGPEIHPLGFEIHVYGEIRGRSSAQPAQDCGALGDSTSFAAEFRIRSPGR